MRRDDLELFEAPYTSDKADRSTDDLFEEALGVDGPEIRALCSEILADLDPGQGGVGWWAPHPKRPLREMIADHLFVCAKSILANLAEARLHELERQDAEERHAEQMARLLSLNQSGTLVMKHPPRLRPSEDLPYRLQAMHIAGFARALGSAFDCLASTMVGVLALPIDILRADFFRVRKYLEMNAGRAAPGNDVREQFRRQLDTLVATAGPEGWMAWANDLRNMVVHRGRRVWQIAVSVDATIVDTRGLPVPRTRLSVLLPRHPARSDIEALAEGGEMSVLTEAVGQTFDGAFQSTIRVVRGASEALLKAWRARRENPSILLQPASQWPHMPSAADSRFPGYAPASIRFEPKAILSDPTMGRRLEAAGLAQRRGT